ncbi:hypothetical protein SAMN04487770_10870 [Butyrivibrio sp. ob235]|uniref:DUF6033 family protein n=1 Tax=Butyrivibrio sp. ob235 TaxID=1761780 RepID=UPI0008CCB2DE|nr:DUF6033 family protein [Butyrivibrio sp. ob235]SEL28352.1 hypothetical protein SAMN04487770_10870 [Butyrivibrio sp. ob235]
MTGINGISAYQQINQSVYNEKSGVSKTPDTGRADQAGSAKNSQQAKVETKAWSPIDTTSSLVPRKTEYGMTIGDVQLSDKAKDYYNSLKSKYHNMEFIAVSKDMKAQVQQNAASYGNANKMVVLIDEEKLERMATDESYRKKYEGIIAMAQTKMSEAKMGLTSSGASVKNFGMSVDSNGKENFFATVNKTSDLQKKRTEKKAAEKKAAKLQERKKAEKKAQEERIQKARDKKAEKADTDKEETEITDNEEYVTFEADSMDELLSKVQTYSYNNASGKVMTQAEQMVGTKIDFRG